MSGKTMISREQFKEFAGAVLGQLWGIVKNMNPERVQHLIEHPEKLQSILQEAFGTPAFRHNKKEDGWELIEDVGEARLSLPNQLELVSLLKKGKNYINGEDLFKRAEKTRANLGQHQAEYLLEHQYEIPEEWRQYYLVFTGTIWHDRLGHRRIPCLFWLDDRWCLNFFWLGDGFFSRVRLLQLHE